MLSSWFKCMLALLTIAVIFYILGIYQSLHACDVCRNRSMPLYTSLQKLIQDVILVLPQEISPSSEYPGSSSDIVSRQQALQDAQHRQCLQRRYEYTLQQDIKLGIDDSVVKFENPLGEAIGSLDLKNLTKDLAVMKQVEVIADEYSRIQKLQDILNDRLLTLAQTCADSYPLSDDVRSKLIAVFQKHQNILLPAPGQTQIFSDTSGDPVLYQDVLLFLRDLVGQSLIYLSRAKVFDGEFYLKYSTKQESKKAYYQHINLRLNPSFIQKIDQEYHCARDTSYDVEKVCRKQEGKFHQMIQHIIGKKSRNAFQEYGNTVAEDLDATGDQLGDDTDSLKGSYKASIKRIQKAINLLRDSNFGRKTSPAQEQLLETYYGRSIEDIRTHTIKAQASQIPGTLQKIQNFFKEVTGKFEEKAAESDLKSHTQTDDVAGTQSKDLIGTDPNPKNISQYSNPNASNAYRNMHQRMVMVVNDTLQELDRQAESTLYYDPNTQMQTLPLISQTIYQAMVTLGDRNQEDTLIHELNAICKHACGIEGNCG